MGIGVPIGTDTFIRQFVAKKCRHIIEDVEKLDVIEDIFIHYQLLRFCQVTRLQFLNSHIILDNRCVLQQQHVDCKIADALLKKGTKQHADGLDCEEVCPPSQSQDNVGARARLSSHDGVPQQQEAAPLSLP